MTLKCEELDEPLTLTGVRVETPGPHPEQPGLTNVHDNPNKTPSKYRTESQSSNSCELEYDTKSLRSLQPEHVCQDIRCKITGTDNAKLDEYFPCRSNVPYEESDCSSPTQVISQLENMLRHPFLPTVTLVVPMPFAGLTLQPSAENKRNMRLLRFCAQDATRDARLKKYRWKSGWKLSLVKGRTRKWPLVLGGIATLVLLCCCWLGFRTDGAGNKWNASSLNVDVSFHWTSWSPWSPCVLVSLSATKTRFRHCLLNFTLAGEPAEECSLEGSADFQVEDCTFGLLATEISLASVLRNDDNETNVPAGASELTATTCDTSGSNDNLTTPVSLRYCDQCTHGEVCVALSHEEVPTCRYQVDASDITGCGGLCRMGLESCKRLFQDAYRCLDDTMCYENEFRCENLLCIPEIKRCDGHMNCYDRTDEYDCPCDLQTHFRCGNNTSCLPKIKRCNRQIDCWDGSDEANCTQACLRDDQFTCTDGRCIPRMFFCDGLADCVDGTDEPFGCDSQCFNSDWRCDNGRCLPKELLCNDRKDCKDGSDEMYCNTPNTKPMGSIT